MEFKEGEILQRFSLFSVFIRLRICEVLYRVHPRAGWAFGICPGSVHNGAGALSGHDFGGDYGLFKKAAPETSQLTHSDLFSILRP